jgi:hypothetical protein
MLSVNCFSEDEINGKKYGMKATKNMQVKGKPKVGRRN